MKLVVLGFGYTAARFVERHAARFTAIVATVTSAEKAARLARPGLDLKIVSSDTADPTLAAEIRDADALLVSVPPGLAGDPMLARFAEPVAQAPRLRWIGYLSTIGVYGDHQGGWVDEATPPRPASPRSRQRLAAEAGWQAVGARTGIAVHVFRLAGIYGPGRSPLQKLRDGTAKRLVKPGQVFNRIHVDDIAAVLAASLDRTEPGSIYNVSDDEPAPPQDVVAFAARVAGLPAPPEEPFEGADLTPMARSFYGENKRVRNRRIREELGVDLQFPTFREGLRALAAEEIG